MVSVQTLELCFADFVSGKSLAQIARERGLCKRTLERYSTKEHWVIHRHRAWDLSKEKIVQEIAFQTKSNDIFISHQIGDLLKEAIAEHRAYTQGKIPRKAVRGGMKKIIGLAKALYHANFADRLNLVNGEAFLVDSNNRKISI